MGDRPKSPRTSTRQNKALSTGTPEGVDHHGMIIKLNETGMRTVACLRAVLEGASNFLRDGVTLNGLQ
ncbi:hypothetical protein AB3X96_23570 [Paraburkholderia sp. BR13439]|uniref:hypothetical protein n=1 Tax=Paraburkholderia TaxID=1822464 RepID=UPI0034CE2C18